MRISNLLKWNNRSFDLQDSSDWLDLFDDLGPQLLRFLLATEYNIDDIPEDDSLLLELKKQIKDFPLADFKPKHGSVWILFAFKENLANLPAPFRKDGILLPFEWRTGEDVTQHSPLLPQGLIELADKVKQQFGKKAEKYYLYPDSIFQDRVDFSMNGVGFSSGWGALVSGLYLALNPKAMLLEWPFSSIQYDFEKGEMDAVGHLEEKITLAASFNAAELAVAPCQYKEAIKALNIAKAKYPESKKIQKMKIFLVKSAGSVEKTAANIAKCNQHNKQRLIRNICLAHVAVLLLLAIVAGVLYWDHNREYVEYYAHISNKNFIPCGIDKLSEKQCKTRHRTFKFIYKGYKSLLPFSKNRILRKVLYCNNNGDIVTTGLLFSNNVYSSFLFNIYEPFAKLEINYSNGKVSSMVFDERLHWIITDSNIRTFYYNRVSTNSYPFIRLLNFPYCKYIPWGYGSFFSSEPPIIQCTFNEKEQIASMMFVNKYGAAVLDGYVHGFKFFYDNCGYISIKQPIEPAKNSFSSKYSYKYDHLEKKLIVEEIPVSGEHSSEKHIFNFFSDGSVKTHYEYSPFTVTKETYQYKDHRLFQYDRQYFFQKKKYNNQNNDNQGVKNYEEVISHSRRTQYDSEERIIFEERKDFEDGMLKEVISENVIFNENITQRTTSIQYKNIQSLPNQIRNIYEENDQHGRRIKKIFMNDDRQPILNISDKQYELDDAEVPGFAIEKIEYSETGERIIATRRYFADASEKIPQVVLDGYSARKDFYDKKTGLLYKTLFLKHDAKTPSVNKKGFAEIRYRYNEAGQMTGFTYCDEKGDPISVKYQGIPDIFSKNLPPQVYSVVISSLLGASFDWNLKKIEENQKSFANPLAFYNAILDSITVDKGSQSEKRILFSLNKNFFQSKDNTQEPLYINGYSLVIGKDCVNVKVNTDGTISSFAQDFSMTAKQGIQKFKLSNLGIICVVDNTTRGKRIITFKDMKYNSPCNNQFGVWKIVQDLNDNGSVKTEEFFDSQNRNMLLPPWGKGKKRVFSNYVDILPTKICYYGENDSDNYIVNLSYDKYLIKTLEIWNISSCNKYFGHNNRDMLNMLNNMINALNKEPTKIVFEYDKSNKLISYKINGWFKTEIEHESYLGKKGVFRVKYYSPLNQLHQLKDLNQKTIGTIRYVEHTKQPDYYNQKMHISKRASGFLVDVPILSLTNYIDKNIITFDCLNYEEKPVLCTYGFYRKKIEKINGNTIKGFFENSDAERVISSLHKYHLWVETINDTPTYINSCLKFYDTNNRICSNAQGISQIDIKTNKSDNTREIIFILNDKEVLLTTDSKGQVVSAINNGAQISATDVTRYHKLINDSLIFQHYPESLFNIDPIKIPTLNMLKPFSPLEGQ